MTQAWLNKFWQLGLANSLIIGSAIALSGEYVLAQIQPDSTLGSESSVVNSVNEDIELIDGGAIRDSNLLHSFQDFNVSEGKAVYFANPQGIENIFNRVTGNNPSQILGRLGVLGDANLFLLNPHGIIFGKYASLDVNGSFVATTANSILFQNGQEFSAIEPQKPILEIKAPLGLQIGNSPGAIINRSQTLDSTGEFTEGLKIRPGKNLALIGGDVSLEEGVITASGGRVELGGLSQSGTVNLNSDGSLSFPESVARGNVFLDYALVDVSLNSEGHGSISINANNLELKERSTLSAGILSSSIGGDLSSPEAQAGDIFINATDKVTLDEFSQIYNDVFSEGVGKAGNVDITTKNLSVTNGSVLSASNFGEEGDAGNVKVNASNTIFIDRGNADSFTGIASIADSTDKGNAGRIDITTKNLSVTNGSQLSATTYNGEGDAGNIKINASDTISIDGSNADPFTKIVAGGIDITTKNLSVTDGSKLSASTYGEEDAGNIKINASDTISIDGGSTGSLITSQVSDTGKANAGGIDITTKNLFVTNDSSLIATTYNGEGDAGSIKIDASDTISINGGSADSFPIITSIVNNFTDEGKGSAGELTLLLKTYLLIIKVHSVPLLMEKEMQEVSKLVSQKIFL